LKVGAAAEGTEGGGADRRPLTGERLDEAALSLGAEPVAVAADGLSAEIAGPVQAAAELMAAQSLPQLSVPTRPPSDAALFVLTRAIRA
jgi:hypothetical protein